MAKTNRKDGRSTTGTRKAPPPPRAAPATPGGPNRIARKEEARRQREALQRKMARRKAYRIVAIVAGALVVVGLVTGGVLYAQHRSNQKRASALQAAACGPVTTVPAYKPASDDRSHIGTQGSSVPTPPALSKYSSVPPTSGPHDPTPLDAGVYTSPPDVYRAIHSLEHAAAIIWYSPAVSRQQAVTQLTTFYGKTINNDHVIVAPYSYPDQGSAGQLPAGKQMVLVAWHHMQQCAHPSLAAAQAFVHSYRLTPGSTETPAYKGDAPEAGVAI